MRLTAKKLKLLSKTNHNLFRNLIAWDGLMMEIETMEKDGEGQRKVCMQMIAISFQWVRFAKWISIARTCNTLIMVAILKYLWVQSICLDFINYVCNSDRIILFLVKYFRFSCKIFETAQIYWVKQNWNLFEILIFCVECFNFNGLPITFQIPLHIESNGNNIENTFAVYLFSTINCFDWLFANSNAIVFNPTSDFIFNCKALIWILYGNWSKFLLHIRNCRSMALAQLRAFDEYFSSIIPGEYCILSFCYISRCASLHIYGINRYEYTESEIQWYKKR